MPDANDVFGPFDGAPWAQSQWFRHAPAWAPTGVLGSVPGGFGSGALALTTSGRTATIGVGRANIRGAGYERVNSGKQFDVPANTHASAARRDRIVIRRDLAAKTIEPVLLQGTPSAAPIPPAFTRVESGVWDLPLFSFLTPANSGSTLSGVIDERLWWDPAAGGLLVAATTSARDTASVYPGLRIYRSDLQRDQTHNGVVWVDPPPAVSLTSAGPTSYAAPFAPNFVTPLRAYRDQSGMVTLDGLINNDIEVVNVIGTWFTLPFGYRPGSVRFGLCYIEGGAVAAYQVNANGDVFGLNLTVGFHPIPVPRYWSFNLTYRAA